MKQIIFFCIFLFLKQFLFAQKKLDKCDLLLHFYNDTTFSALFLDIHEVDDTIIVIDSSKTFIGCNLKNQKGKPLLVQYENNLNFSPSNRVNIKAWQNKILIYKVNKVKSTYEIHFFYKYTNALGSVKYRIHRNKIKNISYSLGQL